MPLVTTPAPCSVSIGLPWRGIPGPVKANGVCLSAYGTASLSRVGSDACVAGASSQQWSYTSLKELRSPGGMCVQPSFTYGMIVKACTGTSTGQRWTLK